MSTPHYAVEAPRIDDPILRQSLIDWFLFCAGKWHEQADAFQRGADGLKLWRDSPAMDLAIVATEAEAREARCRAQTCEQFANDLETARYRPVPALTSWPKLIAQ